MIQNKNHLANKLTGRIPQKMMTEYQKRRRNQQKEHISAFFIQSVREVVKQIANHIFKLNKLQMSNIDEQFLPLDSSIKTEPIPDYSTSTGFRTDSMCGDDSEVFQLTSKISQLEKNYMEMEKKYLRKIKELKQELLEKHQNQSLLNHQLSTLSKQYNQHKQEIQKISTEIKNSLLQNADKQHRSHKIKSTSPKNHTNNSPKRLIKKSLEIAKNQILQPKKQFLSKDVSSSQDIDISRNTQRNDKKITVSAELTLDYKKSLTLEQDNLKNSFENPINSSNQPKNVRKPLYSPKNQTNGPNPKKKLLFNSTKQLDLFSKPLQNKQIHTTLNGSPQRRINISPMQKKKQNIVHESNKIVLQKQIKKQLTVIEQKPIRLEVRQNEPKKAINIGAQQPSSPAHRKKTSSPENALGLLRKKISNKNLTIKTDFPQTLKESKQSDKEQAKQQKIEQTEKRDEKRFEMQKRATKLQAPSSKYLKMPPETTKFSPGRKLIRNSPTDKKTVSGVGLSQKPKLFTNMREKFDDNIFK